MWLRALVWAAAARVAAAGCGSCAGALPSGAPVADSAYLACCACRTPEISGLGLDASDVAALCGALPAANATLVAPLVARALYAVGEMQGHWWLDDAGDVEENATACLVHLLASMPKRDALLLFEAPLRGLDFLAETVRLALRMWPRLDASGVPWRVFLDNVLPYAVLNEARDIEWRPRPRLAQLFASAWTGAANATAAMRNLAALVPRAAAAFAPSLLDAAGDVAPQPGPVVTWRSETSPGYLSPAQVAGAFGSCTGTGIFLVAAARAIGVPARLAGCSQTDVPGDDHHWAEFYDPTSAGPFGTYWHTKEGTSRGNEGGPWDAPSGPMSGCLRGVVPGSALNTMWAGAWSSNTYLPTLWASDGPLTGAAWAFVGGENVCGAYCTAWGCGPNNTERWTQAECGGTAAQ